MTPEQYAQVKQLFLSAIAMPVGQRAEFVEQHTGDDPLVQREVESLLEHHLEQTQHVDPTELIDVDTAPQLPPTPAEFDSTRPLDMPTSPGGTPSSQTVTRQLRKLGPIGLLPLGGLVVCLLLLVVLAFAHASIHSIVNERRKEDIQSVLSFVEQATRSWVDRERSEVERLVATSHFRQIAIDLASSRRAPSELTPEEIERLKLALDDELDHYLGPDGSYAIWNRNLVKRLDVRPESGDHNDETSTFTHEVLTRALDGETVVLFPGNRPSLTQTEPELATWVRVISPLRDNDDNVLAVILLRSPRVARSFSQSLGSLRIGESGEAFAFDRSGLLLTESRYTEQLLEAGLLPPSKAARSALNIYLKVPPRDLRLETQGSVTNSQAPGTWTPQDWPDTELIDAATQADENSGSLLNGYRNYMGYPTYGTWRWLDDYEFGIAYEVSRAEANRPYWFLKLELVVISLVTLLCFFGLAASLVSVRRLQQRVQSLQVVGSYTLLEKIGEGGMGQVFRARHTLLKRPTAVKLLKAEIPNPRLVELFEREVQIASQLMHPNTIQIYDYGESDSGRWYYAMEFVEGQNLEQIIADEFPFSTDRLIHILSQIAGAVGEAHHRGVIHRDIKPQNIMLSRRAGMDDFVKVLDFGLATVLTTESLRQIRIAGTMRYMAPECFLTPQEIGPASDVYSMAALAYEMLTGRSIPTLSLEQTPELSAWASRLRILADDLPRYTDKRREELRMLVLASLATNVEARPANASEFLERLTVLSDL